MRLGLRLALVLVLAFAVRLANLTAIASLPVASYQENWAATDMAVNVAWADAIRNGDWLGRRTVHPFTLFMAMIAPKATWERWWGGASVFHQAPLYAYVLAGIRAAFGTDFWSVALGHLLLGLGSVALVFLVAARTFDANVATLAAAGAALYGPLVFHEAIWVRDTLAVTTSLLMLWTLGRAPDGGWVRWLVAGMTAALALLTRETVLLFAPLALLWAGRQLRGRTRWTGLAALACGLGLGLAPLIARNAVVDAPLFSFSTRAIEGFVYGHAADGSPTDLVIPKSARRILGEADGSLWRTVWLTLATHESVPALLAWEARKLGAVVSSYEPADNVNWYYFAERSPVLRFGPPYALVLGLAVVGLWLERQRGPKERLLRWFVVATVAGLMYATVVGRYRLVLVVGLLPYAAATLVRLVAWVRLRAWRPAALTTAVAAGIALLSTRLLADQRMQLEYRLNEPIITAIRLWEDRGDADAAFAELRLGLARAWRPPGGRNVFPGGYEALKALMIISDRSGRPADVLPDLEAMLEAYPEDPVLQEYVGEHWRDRMGDEARAAEYFARAEQIRERIRRR